MKGAAVPVAMGLVAAGVVEWGGWPREAGIFAAITGIALGGLIVLQSAILKRIDALDRSDRR